MRLNAVTNAEFLLALSHGVFSRQELVEEVGLRYETVGAYLEQLHKRGLTHIVEWRRSEGHWHLLPIYKLGAGKDAPRPKPKSQAQRQRECNDRKRRLNLQLAMLGKGTIEPAANGRLRITPNL